jgi:acyl-coenzyme A thioesterase PaaI-like protein
MAIQKSLQDTYAPHNACFGCGPSNTQGLKIKSLVSGDDVIAHWTPEPHHEAFPGVLNGGIIGALLDCHSNWTAAYHLMKASGVDHPPCTVTASFFVKLLKPTPSGLPVHLSAKPKEIKGDRATIFAKLFSGSDLCATCEGVFVAVKPGHPAYHRW